MVKIAYFAHDLADAAIQRRASTLRRGGVFAGPLLIAVNPAILLSFATAVARRLLTKAGFPCEDRPAPYSVAFPWCAEDFVFTARYAPKHCKAVLFDYAFQTVAAPYIPDQQARTFVIMHDLFSSRHAQFERLGHRDSLPAISEAREMQYLSGADAVVAIQPAEAGFVKKRAPHLTVVCAPMAAKPVDRPQPGTGNRVLFVGTSTAPNVAGLNWFLKEVWPLIAKQKPDTIFWIAGSCGRALQELPAGAKVLGVVPDLAPLYRDAGVVVSPLPGGSGLKIKLVEGLAQGKAMVATAATILGVEHLVAGTVEVTDEPDVFAARTVALLQDEALRMSKATLALDAAREHFAADACYREFLDLVCA